MKPEPGSPGQADFAGADGLSIGGESVAFTMQAEAGHMTIDEAIASGLFDLPDEPGMVRIPVSMNVMIPWHLLQPEPEPPADHGLPQHRNRIPPYSPESPQGRRFGNYPRGIAAQNVMASFTSQMSPAPVASVPGLPAAVVASAGRPAGTSVASVTVGSSGGLLDAGAQAELRGLALAAGRGAVTGPLGAAVAAALRPTQTAMEDRPLAVRKLAEARVHDDDLQASHDERSAFTITPPSGRLQGTPLPILLPPLPGLTPPEPLPPLAGFTPNSTLPGSPLDRPSCRRPGPYRAGDQHSVEYPGAQRTRQEDGGCGHYRVG